MAVIKKLTFKSILLVSDFYFVNNQTILKLLFIFFKDGGKLSFYFNLIVFIDNSQYKDLVSKLNERADRSVADRND